MVFPGSNFFSIVWIHLCRKIYWTDVGKQPKIEASNLDGSDREILINRELGEPNHLVIDYRRQSLCWSDSKLERVECSSLDGSARRTVLSIEGSIFGLSIFQVCRRQVGSYPLIFCALRKTSITSSQTSACQVPW